MAALLLSAQALTKTCVQFMRASLIMARVQLAGELYPGVYLAPIIVGTVSACGGAYIHHTHTHTTGAHTHTCTHARARTHAHALFQSPVAVPWKPELSPHPHPWAGL